MKRRRFIQTGISALSASPFIQPSFAQDEPALPEYEGPNVILVRFGGGVRRRETIDEDSTFAPFFRHELCKRGALFPLTEIEQLEGVETSHGQGTLYILTGKYDRYEDIGKQFLGERFEAKVPTLFEYFRKAYNVPEHQALIVNGEDRTQEEFYSFSNHHLFGVSYRSTTLSLYRFKVFLLRRQIQEGVFEGEERIKKQAELEKLESIDYRAALSLEPLPEVEQFWERWRGHFGESGLVNPRGDRLLTEIGLRAMKQLRPRLMMINYNDPDYVHWGNPAHYTLGVSVIDQALKQLVTAVEADEFYRDNTVFVIVPDCGRDSNRMMAVPYQHHFGSKSSHEIFAFMMGPGIEKGAIVDKPTQQTDIAPTIGRIMGFETEFVEGRALEEAFS